MVIVMVLRPDVLRHARQHAKDEAETSIERPAAKYAAVTAFMQQRKHAHHHQGQRNSEGDSRAGRLRGIAVGEPCDGSQRQ